MWRADDEEERRVCDGGKCFAVTGYILGRGSPRKFNRGGGAPQRHRGFQAQKTVVNFEL